MQETPKSLIWLRFTAEPRTGRFITRDGYRGESENADTWHLYAYCANNPINYVDPSGHIALPALKLLISAAVATAYMSTAEFQKSWRDFCTIVGNGLSSLGRELRKGLGNAISWSKTYLNKVESNIKAFTKIAEATQELEKVRKKRGGHKYYKAYLRNYKNYKYVAIGKGIKLGAAKNRIRVQASVFAKNKMNAKRLARSFHGVVGPEVGRGKANVMGYYYHYHVWGRANKAHIWYFGR